MTVSLLDIKNSLVKIGLLVEPLKIETERQAIKKDCLQCEIYKLFRDCYFNDKEQPPAGLSLAEAVKSAPCPKRGKLGCIAFNAFGVLLFKELAEHLKIVCDGLTEWSSDTANTGILALIEPIKSAIKDIDFIQDKSSGNTADIIAIISDINELLAIFQGTTQAPLQSPIIDKIKEAFKAPFKEPIYEVGYDGKSLFDIFLADIQMQETAKAKAARLLLAYNSKAVVSRESGKKPSFATWTKWWGELLGNDTIATYHPNQLNTSAIENRYGYLQTLKPIINGTI